MEVQVILVGNISITQTLHVRPDDTVLDVKREFCRKIQKPENQIKLLYQGLPLALTNKIGLCVPPNGQITAIISVTKSSGVLKNETEVVFFSPRSKNILY